MFTLFNCMCLVLYFKVLLCVNYFVKLLSINGSTDSRDLRENLKQLTFHHPVHLGPFTEKNFFSVKGPMCSGESK